jgi:L-aspartate oxidase
LEFSLKEIDRFLNSDIGELLKFKLLTAKAIVKQALNRKKSLGAHYIIN